jgi:fucose 4-O-acetylase-like acetyltransferase
MPVSSGWTARLGRESLSIYILHGLVMKLLIASGIYSSINQSLEVILLALASLLLLPLLASSTAKLLMARDRLA